jgi:Kef-type K+ transport system membrane component KefB
MEVYLRDLAILLFFTVVISYIFSFLKQPLLVGYIVAGALTGPWGLGLIKEIDFISATSYLGIIFLLFLAGLVLHPQKLFRVFKEALWATILASFFSFLTVFILAVILGWGLFYALIIGISLMFSSTVLTVKLLPTTSLHHKRIGAICIGILILQDILAVGLLAFIYSYKIGKNFLYTGWFIIVKVVLIFLIAIILERYVFRKILSRVEKLHELIFIMAIAWCLGFGWLGYLFGISVEVGAFLSGVALARHPISLFISERLKPLRDFFLLLFFFSLGAKFNIQESSSIFLPAVIISAIYVGLKPVYFRKVLIWNKEEPRLAREAGFRLGQASEFSLLIIFALFNEKLISVQIFNLVQLITILTIIFSAYLTTSKFPTPVAPKEELLQH